MRQLSFVFATICGAVLFSFAGSAFAQSHTWTSTEHNATALWSTDTFWDAGTAPGSLLPSGAASDIVVVANTTGSNQTIRIQDVDVGTIDSLTIGGGAGRAALHVRGNNGNLDIANDLTIGAGGAGGQGGQLVLTNNEAAVRIGGNVISGSDIFDNRITVDGPDTTDGLVLVGDIDSAAARGGTAAFEIDFYVNRQQRVTLSPNATFNVDGFFVGNQYSNGASNGTNDFDKTYTDFTVDRGQLFRANEVGVGRTTSSSDTTRNNNMAAVLNIADATVTTVDSDTASGNNNVVVGFASSVAPARMNVEGTVNVNAGGVLEFGRGAGVTTGSGQLFIGSMNANIVNADTTAVGTVNVNSGGIVRGQYDGTGSSGRIVVGTGLRGDGTLNVNGGGTVVAPRGLSIGGLSDTAADDGSTGQVNINAGGVVDVSKPLRNGGNVEVGRGGTGSLNVMGGTLNLGWGNFVVGQNSQAADPGDPTAIPPIPARPAIPNNSRGTVVFSQGAIVNIGDASDDGDPAGPTTSNFNINRGGGDITQTGAGTTVTIEGSLQMQNSVAAGAVDESTNPNSSYTIDNGTLAIGAGLFARSNLGGTNTFKVVGDAATISVGDNLGINDSSFTLEFDFMGGSAVSSIDVGNNANLEDATNGAATLTLSNTVGLATYTSDIVLLDVTGNTNGAFANAPADTAFGSYKLVYDYDAVAGMAGGGQSVALVQGTVGPLACDLDSDGDCDQTDIDLLYNGSPTGTDIANWLTQASSPANTFNPTGKTFVLGDVNLDGSVNSTDLGALLNNFNSTTGVTWDGGDLNDDELVNSTDLGALLNNFNFASNAASAVPEPSALVPLLAGAIVLLLGGRRRR